MADDILVGVGADVAEFQRDANQIVAIAKGLQRDIARALQGTEIIPDLSADARLAGTQLMSGLRASVQEGGEGLQRDVAAALIPTSLGGEFTRLAGVVRAGTQNISTDLGREGHEAGRALVTGIAAELPAVQQVLSAFTRAAGALLSGRILTDLTPAGQRAGRELVSGLRTAVQAQQGALRGDIVGSLIPTSLAGDFARLTTQISGSADTLARALGAGGRDAGAQYVVGLAGGLSSATRVVDEFRASVSARLSRADLLGDLGRQGELSGAQLVRGVTAAITGGATTIQRAVTATLVPANLPAQLAVITTGVSREIARLVPQLSATGTLAGRALVASLGSELSQGAAVIVREFSRGAAGSVASVDLFGDLTPAGQRAGAQLLSGLTQSVTREGQALRGTLATALIPTTVTGELGRLTTTITAGLQGIPPLFLTAGSASGSAFTASLGTQLNESKALLSGFARDASAALTASLTIGDTARTGEQAGRALASAIATGVAAEAPRIRAALSTALIPASITSDLGRITGAVEAETRALIPVLSQTGQEGGRQLVQGFAAEASRLPQLLRGITAGEVAGVVVNVAPIVAATEASRQLQTASVAAASGVREVAQATATITSAGLSDAAEVAQLLAEAERNAARVAQQSSADIVNARSAERAAAQGVAAQVQSTALVVVRGAQEQTAAIGGVNASVRTHIGLLQQYAQTVDATDANAVAAWREQATLVRDNARGLGIEKEELYKLDRAIQKTIDDFRTQAAEARNAKRAIEGQSAGVVRGAGTGAAAAELAAITRNANQAKAAVGGVAIAGRSLQQITGRLGPALVGVGFGLEALARGGEAGASGIRTALRSVASFAAFFGPKGLIVSGVAAGLAAVLDFFDQSRKEMEETRKKFTEEIGNMVRSADTIGLQRKLQELQVGTIEIDDKGIAKFKGGIVDLQQQVDDLKADIKAAGARFDFFSPKGVNSLTRQLEELEPTLEDRKRQFQSLSTTIKNFPTLPRDIVGLPTKNVTAGVNDTKDAIKALEDRVRALLVTYEQLTGDTTAQATIARQIIPLYDQIAASAERYGVSTTEAARQTRELRDALAEVRPVQLELGKRRLTTDLARDIGPLSVTGIIDEVTVSPALKIDTVIPFDEQTLSRSLQESLRAAKQASGRLDFAELFGTRQEIADATENVTIATANLRREIEAASQTIDQSGASDTQKAAALELLIRLYTETGSAANEAADDVQSLSDTLGDVGEAARSIAQVGREISGADSAVLDMIDSVGRLAGALSDLKDIKLGDVFKSAGNLLKAIPVIGNVIAAAVGTYRSIIGAISGKATDDANNAIVKENTEAIVRLTQDIRGVGDTIGSLLGASRALDTSDILAARRGTSGFGRGFKNIESLDAELREAGTSIRDLIFLADRFGITITDAAGRVSAQGLADLNIALKLAAHAAANFEDDIQSLRTKQDARREIFDVDDARSAFADSIEQIRQFAPELAQRFLVGISAATPAARAAAEQSIRDLFDFITTSGIDLTPFLGGFESVEDFIASLVSADRYLDDLAGTAKEASGEMVNVVRGFRDFNLERARFQATANDVRAFATIPRPNPVGTPSGATALTTIGSFTLAPVIHIDGRDKDAGEITTEVVEELRRRARGIANPDVRKTVYLLPS